MPSIDQKIQWYLSEFEAFEKSLNGEKHKPVHDLRRKAIGCFAELGFPNTRHEEWRFTNISPIIKTEFKPVTGVRLNGISQKDIRRYMLDGAVHLVFVNGIFSSELSDISALPKGIHAGSLAEALKNDPDKVLPYVALLVKGDENAFTALNTAFFRDGAFVLVPAGANVDRILQFIFVAVNNGGIFSAHPRNLIVAEPGCHVKITETYLGLATRPYLNNSVTEIIVNDNCTVEHNKFQFESLNSYHMGTTNISMGSSCNYVSNVISIGGAIARNNITAVLGAEGSECTLNGLSLGSGFQTIDNHTMIDHAVPHCSSHELYKSILDGESKGVFNGKIFVRKDAQKTDAKQTNKTLLLSDDATINTKPQLEIFADDVKCTHGATIGQLDAEQVFYLRTRGIDITAAREILTLAFAEDVVNRITVVPLREQLKKMIQDKLKKTGAANK